MKKIIRNSIFVAIFLYILMIIFTHDILWPAQIINEKMWIVPIIMIVVASPFAGYLIWFVKKINK